MPLKKIADLPDTERCQHPEHNPPAMIVLPPGIYEHACPRCLRKVRFTVRNSVSLGGRKGMTKGFRASRESPMTRYEKGRADGFVDGCILSQPIREDRHTYEKYLQVDTKYRLAIFNLNPSEYQQGYGRGLDMAAIYLRINSEEGKE